LPLEDWLTTETQFTAEARFALASAITEAGGNEVFFFGSLDEEGRLESVEVIARGHLGAVPVFLERAREHQVLIHNHPGGDLTPSPADLSIASEAGARRLGFFIIDNLAELVYRVVEPFAESKEIPLDLEEIASAFKRGGLLDAILPAFEERSGQVDMAVSVAQALNGDEVVALEAGTGVGKSFAYLLPSILWAVRNRGRVVVSTQTIPLGEQLISKDLPTLDRALDVEFKSALIKGRGNYACRRKTGEVARQPEMFSTDDERDRWNSEIIARLGEAKEGTLSEMPGEPPNEVWSDFQSSSDQSLKARCPHYRSCFYYEARRRAFGAHIVVVNHHLLFADLALRRSSGDFESDLVIPGYQRVVFDEAHHLEEVACHHLGAEISRRGVLQVLGRLVSSPRRKKGTERGRLPWLISNLREAQRGLSLEYLEMTVLPEVRRLRKEAEMLFLRAQVQIGDALEEAGFGGPSPADPLEGLMARIGNGENEIPIEIVSGPLSDLREQLLSLRRAISKGADLLEEEPFEPAESFQGALVEYRSAIRGLGEQVSAIDFFLGADGGIQPWLEVGDGKQRNITFRAAPLRVDELLAEFLYRPLRSVVMTSATLQVGGRWSYLGERLGWDRVEGGRFRCEAFGSPFDWKRQVLLGLPTNLPAPDSPQYLVELAEVIVDSASFSKGRTFVLFTSHRMLRDVARMIDQKVKEMGFPLLVQGQAPRSELLARFVRAGNAVLLGNQSYWEGIDVPGATLSCIVVARLPFRIPNHPLELGRAEDLEARGRSPFAHLALPRAVLSLRQGFGRLIRTSTDRGVVVIADSRIRNRNYGTRFINSLPDCQRSDGTWDEIREQIAAYFSEKEMPA